jgi:hypothetical protein
VTTGTAGSPSSGGRLHRDQSKNDPPSVAIAGVDLGAVLASDPMVHRYDLVPILRGLVTVTLSTGYANTELRYTLNGNNPTPTSYLYTVPVKFKENMTGEKTALKVRAYDKANAGFKSKIIRADFRIIPSK